MILDTRTCRCARVQIHQTLENYSEEAGTNFALVGQDCKTTSPTVWGLRLRNQCHIVQFFWLISWGDGERGEIVQFLHQNGVCLLHCVPQATRERDVCKSALEAINGGMAGAIVVHSTYR